MTSGRLMPPAAAALALLLLQACALPPAPEAVPPQPAVKPSSIGEQPDAAPTDVKSVQRGLLELGYYEAGVDGIVGPRTTAAVRAFQKDKKLQITGDLTPETVRSIVNSAASARQRLSSFTGLAQPVYEAGDRFYYSNGGSETVLSLDGQRVVWESSDGTRRTAPRNFILPPFAWYGEHGSGSFEAEAAPEILWPLKPGTEARFSISGTMMGSSARSEDIFELWNCAVRSSTRVAVPAGSFDTIPIVCDVFLQPSGPKRTITWNYAPAVGHYVRRTERLDEKEETAIDLVAVELGGRDWPAAARAGLDWALQHALENESSGRTVQWESSALPGHIEIQALSEVEYAGFNTCRRFAATRFDAEGMKRIYPGLACRAVDGSWALAAEFDRAHAELP